MKSAGDPWNEYRMTLFTQDASCVTSLPKSTRHDAAHIEGFHVGDARVKKLTPASKRSNSQVRQTRNVDVHVNVDVQSHPAGHSTDKNYMFPFMKQPTENNFCSICWFLHKNMLKDTFVLLFFEL